MLGLSIPIALLSNITPIPMKNIVNCIYFFFFQLIAGSGPLIFGILIVFFFFF
jgi:hypothetical protein